MGRTDKVVKSGVSWTTVLVMIFIVLKVMGLTTMSWAWVFSPWWLSLVVGLTSLAVITLLIVIFGNN
jgi:hypothetical protein